MTRSYTFTGILILSCIVALALINSCANIIPPTGGLKDTLPPILIKATPEDSTKHFNTNRITLEFDEYVNVENAQENVVIWPNPKGVPSIEGKLRTVTVKLKDSLEKNTTYTINFGNSLKDNNEGNPAKNFSYVFTTGDKLDGNILKGKVVVAETGKTDSTLLVVLHTNLNDTAIQKTAPRYYAKLDGKGNFRFFNLPTDTFAVFVVPNDYTKRYDDSTKLFGFLSQPVYVRDTSTKPLTLLAYQEYKATDKKALPSAAANTPSKKKKTVDSTLKMTADFDDGKQDFLKNMELTFSDTLQTFDTTKFHFTDTSYKPLPGLHITADTVANRLFLSYKWKENTPYKLVIEKDAVADSSGFTLAQNDTLSFYTLRESDYGSIRMRFQNLDTSRHPVLELIQNDKIVQSVPLNNYQWYQKFIRPGEYEMRMLYDTNRNGIWDTGSYVDKRQPEVVQEITTKTGGKITIRGNWDNEQNITL